MKDSIKVEFELCPATLNPATCSIAEKGRDCELRYNRILRHSWEEIYIFDKDLKFLEVSQGALKNLGYTWREMKELTVLDIKAFLTLEELKVLVKPLLTGEENIINCGTAHKRKDGSVYDVDVRLQYIVEEEPIFIAMVSDVTERNRYEDELRALAFRDPGTELYNKRFFMEQLTLSTDSAHRRHSTIGLLVIDMDDFSIVNNTYGHLAGDDIICDFAAKINQVFGRKSDIVARYGGDEFVVMCVDIEEEDLLIKCGELSKLFNEPYMHEGNEIIQTASIGVCFQTDCTTAEDLIKGADCAMYKAKDAGKNTVRSCNKCEQENL